MVAIAYLALRGRTAGGFSAVNSVGVWPRLNHDQFIDQLNAVPRINFDERLNDLNISGIVKNESAKKEKIAVLNSRIIKKLRRKGRVKHRK